jgi:hypothetical protein
VLRSEVGSVCRAPENFSLFGVSFIHAVLDERLAVTSREILLVGEILAGIQLVLLTHVVKFLITAFAEAVLHKVLAIISLESLISPLLSARLLQAFILSC